jgi:hypothetical protein
MAMFAALAFGAPIGEHASALYATPTSATVRRMSAVESISARPPRRDRVSTRLDPAVLEIVERTAAAERRPVSSVVRNVIEDWAAAATRQEAL